MDRDVTRASGGVKEYASARAALLSPRYDAAPRPPPGSGGDLLRRESGGSVLPALAPAVLHHPPPPGRAASPNAFKRSGWTTPRTPSAGDEPRFPGIDGPPRQRSRSLLDDASTGSLDSDSDWNALQSAKPAPRRPEMASPPDGLHGISPPEIARPHDMERDQLAYMEQMYNTISTLTAELEKERQDRTRLENEATIARLVTESEYTPVDAVTALTPTLTEVDDDAYGFSPMIRIPVAPAAASRSFRPSPPQVHQSKRSIGTGSSAPSTQLPKDQVELCTALGKNAELRIRTREMERTAEKSSQELDQAQKQMKLAERRISNREEKLRGLLKEKMNWQKQLKDMRDQVVEEKMRQVDIYRRMESLKREHSTQLEEMENMLQNANVENEELRAHVGELRAQQTYQARRMEELSRQVKEEKDNFNASIAETRQRFKEWKENEANALRMAKEQALSSLKTEYELKIARHQEEKQKLRDKVKDLEVSLKLMQKDRTLSPLELRLRKATILGARDNGGTSEAELIESHARIRELETLLEHSQEYQRRQDNIIKVSEATISRLVQEREVTALDNLSAHPLTLNSAPVGGDDLASFASIGIGGSRSPRDIRKPSQYSNLSTGNYEKPKSISLPRPSRLYPPATVARMDHFEGATGQAGSQERKSVLPEPLRMSTLDAVAPITPTVTPKPAALAAPPMQAAPPSHSVPSAKEEYLVNELARLRDELEQVKMRQMQSTVVTPHTAESIDTRMVPNDSNERGGDSKSCESTGVAGSSDSEASRQSLGADSVSVNRTTDISNKGAIAATTVELVDAADCAATRSSTPQDGEVNPSELPSINADECDHQHCEAMGNSTEHRDPAVAGPVFSCDAGVGTEDFELSCSEVIPIDGADDSCDIGAYTENAEISSSADTPDDDQASGCDRGDDNDEASAVIQAQQTKEDIGQLQLLDSPAEVEVVALSIGLEGDASAIHQGNDNNDSRDSDDSILVAESIPNKQVEGDIAAEPFIDLVGFSETAVQVEIEAVADAVPGDESDLKQPVDVGTCVHNEGICVCMPEDDFSVDATSIADPSGMWHTEEPIERVLGASSLPEVERLEDVDTAEGAINISDQICEDDYPVDLGQPDGFYDSEAVPSVLVLADVTPERLLNAPHSFGDEEPTNPDLAHDIAIGSRSGDADSEDTDQLSSSVVDFEELKDTSKPPQADPSVFAAPLPLVLKEEDPISADIEEAGSIDDATTGAIETSEIASAYSMVVKNADTVVIKAFESEAIMPSEYGTEAERSIPTAVILANTGDVEEGKLLDTVEGTESVEVAEPNKLDNSALSGCFHPGNAENVDGEIETSCFDEPQSPDTTDVADECLKLNVMAIIDILVDQCGANELDPLLETLESLTDVSVQSFGSIPEPEVVTDNCSLSDPSSISGDEVGLVVDDIVDTLALGEGFDSWDTVEPSDYLEPLQDPARGSEESKMMTEAQVRAELTDDTEVADSLLSHHAASCSPSDIGDHCAALSIINPTEEPSLTLPSHYAASCSPSDTGDHCAALGTTIDPAEEPSLTLPSHEMQPLSGALEGTDASNPSIEDAASGGDGTVLEMAEASCTCVEAGTDSTVSATMLSDGCLDIDEPVATTTAITATPDDRVDDANLCGDASTSGLHCSVAADIPTSPVGEVSSIHHSSIEARPQSPVAACDLIDSHVSTNSECVMETMENEPSENQSSRKRLVPLTPSVVIESAHQEAEFCDADRVDSEDREACVSSPVDAFETPLCSSAQNSSADYRASASTFVEQTVNTALIRCLARVSVELEEARPITRTLFTTISIPSRERRASRDQIEVVESVDFGVESNVEAILREMIDALSASNELLVSDSQPHEEPSAFDESIDATVEPDNAEIAADIFDDANAASSVSCDANTSKDDTVLQHRDLIDDLAAHVGPPAIGSQVAPASEELLDSILSCATSADFLGKLENGVEAAEHQVPTDAASSDSSSNGDNIICEQHAPTADSLHIVVDAAIENAGNNLATQAASTRVEAMTSVELLMLPATANRQEEPVAINEIAQELAIGAVARAVASALFSAEIHLNMMIHDDALDKCKVEEEEEEEDAEEAPTQSPTLSDLAVAPEILVSIEDTAQELATGAVARAVTPTLVSDEIHPSMDDCAAEGEMEMEEAPVEVSVLPVGEKTQEWCEQIEEIAHELAISAVARAMSSALVSAEIHLNMEHDGAGEREAEALIDSSVFSFPSAEPQILPVAIEEVAQELVVGAVARAVKSALLSAEIHLNMTIHDAAEDNEVEEAEEALIHLPLLSISTEILETLASVEKQIEPSLLSDSVSVPEVHTSIEDTVQELAVGAVARVVASALISADIQLNMDHHDHEITEMTLTVPPMFSTTTNSRALALPIEEIARELAVGAVARVLTLALLSTEIHLNMGHFDAIEDDVADDNVGVSNDELPTASTTSVIHDGNNPVEFATGDVPIVELRPWQASEEPEVDPEVADLLGSMCSAVVGHEDESQEYSSCSGSGFRRQEQDGMRDVKDLCADLVSVVENCAAEMTMHSPIQSSQDCLALTPDAPVRQALDEVVATVSEMATMSTDRDFVGDMETISPHRSEAKTAMGSFSPRDQLVDSVNAIILSLLAQLESAHPVSTNATVQVATEPQDAEREHSVNDPTHSAQPTDPPASPRLSDIDTMNDTEVRAVLTVMCSQIEQSSTVALRETSNEHESERIHSPRRSSQSALPTVFERPSSKITTGTRDLVDKASAVSVVEDRRGSVRRKTKRNGSILAVEQLLAWDIPPSNVDAAESAVKRYASKRRTSRRGLSEPSRLTDHSNGQNPHLLAYGIQHENGDRPFSLMDDAILRVDPNARHISQDDDAELASEIIAKRKKMHYEAYCKSMTQRTTPAFNYAPVSIKFEWSDFVVASPVSPSSRPSPVQRMRLLLKRGARLPCGQYVIVSAFVRPLEDGNETLRVQIYDSERVEEFIFDFRDDHIKKYVAGWTGEDDQMREFVAKLEFRREQSVVVIKLPEKKGIPSPHDRGCGSDNDGDARTHSDSRIGSTIKIEHSKEERIPKTPSRRGVFSSPRPSTAPDIQLQFAMQGSQKLDPNSTREDDEGGRRPVLSAVSDVTDSSYE